MFMGDPSSGFVVSTNIIGPDNGSQFQCRIFNAQIGSALLLLEDEVIFHVNQH